MALLGMLQALPNWIDQHPWSLVPLILFSSWLLWWNVRFTIIPTLRPYDPKEVLYMILCELKLSRNFRLQETDGQADLGI